MGSADHAGRLTTHWAPPPPASSGGSPRVPLSLLHVPKLWVCRFLAACGPMNPCEAEWSALIGRRLLPWIEECVSLLWKWSVINPYHYVDVYILCIYAEVDGLNLVL